MYNASYVSIARAYLVFLIESTDFDSVINLASARQIGGADFSPITRVCRIRSAKTIRFVLYIMFDKHFNKLHSFIKTRSSRGLFDIEMCKTTSGYSPYEAHVKLSRIC